MRMMLLVLVLMATCAVCGYFAGGVIEQWSGMTRDLADSASSSAGKSGAGSVEINFEPGAGSWLGAFIGAAAGFVMSMRFAWRRARGGGRAEWFSGD